MVEEYATHIWKRLGGACLNMAAAIDDLICNFELAGVSMDFGTTLLFGWILFGVFVLALCFFIYNRHLKPRKSTASTDDLNKASTDHIKTATDKLSASVASNFSGASAGKNKFSSFGSAGVHRLSGEESNFILKSTSSKIPTVNGIDKDSVDWVSRMLVWIFNDPAASVDVVNLWTNTLNSIAKGAHAEHGVNVEIQEIQKDESLPPLISNVNIEVSPKDDISLICNAVITKVTFTIHTSRQKGDSTLVTVYQAVVTSYGGKLRVTCNPHDLLTTISFVDHPNLNIALKPISGHQGVDALDEQALQDVLDEILTNTLSSWVIRIKFGEYRNCPVFRRAVHEAQPIKPIHYDSMTAVPQLPISPSAKKTKRLLVKVIKANGLGAMKGCKDPYCIVEMDEPPQKHQTSFASETNNPTWDEHFIFDLNNDSAEILFELYDKAKPDRSAFLGLGIVSVDDLIKTPNHRQSVALQSRPYLEDPVSGSITVEFLFMEPSDIPILSESAFPSQSQLSPYNKARTETNRLVTPGGTMVTTTTTTISKPSTGTGDVVTNGVDTVTDTALRELENRQFALLPPSTTTSKSTLIIHSVQRPPEVVVVDGDKLLADENAKDKLGKADSIASSSVSSKEDLVGRSRPKERRSFVNTIKKRFSFRGSKRSKSMEHGGEVISRDGSNSRSTSADRARRTNIDVPGSTMPHIPAVIASPEIGSGRSSLSDQSGISESSTQTYLNEMSTLVIEAVENGLVKHYLLPASLARKSKWRKRGTKLHIFNDHIFVAKHFPGTTPCQVCSKVMPRRIGKQGYECRDCQLRCHKVCHVKIDTPCPNSTANMLELEYVHEPSASILQPLHSKKSPRSN